MRLVPPPALGQRMRRVDNPAAAGAASAPLVLWYGSGTVIHSKIRGAQRFGKDKDSKAFNLWGKSPARFRFLATGWGNLYGTTTFGGNGGNGTVFSIETNGTAFATLHNFPTGDPFTVLQHTSQTNSSRAEPLTGWRQPRACRTVRFEVPSPTMLDWSQCPAVERG